MKIRLLMASAAVAALAVPSLAAQEQGKQLQKKTFTPRVRQVEPVQPVEPVRPVDQVAPVDTDVSETPDAMMGVPPLGQSPEWRERLAARTEAHRRRVAEVDADKPDVLLDVPDVSVEEISFEIDNVQAHLALDAKVANLVKLTAGVDLGIDRVKLLIKGVHAEATLKVRLKHVAQIVDRALTTIDRNPQIVSQLLSTVEKTVTTVGEVAKVALAPGGVLAQTVNTLGQTVQKVVDTTGRIVERTLDTTGQLVNSKPVGDLADLKLVKMRVEKGGTVVRMVENPSGGMIVYSTDSEGNVTAVKTFQSREEALQGFKPQEPRTSPATPEPGEQQ